MNWPESLQFKLADERECTLGESPVWDDRENTVLWCDCLAGHIHELNPLTRQSRTWTAPAKVGSLGLCESGRLVVALADRIAFLDRASGRFSDLVGIPLPANFLRLNDGKVGPDGAFWVGSMDERSIKEPVAGLYRVTSHSVELKREGLFVSNGLAWSLDGRTMYHSDSRGCWIDAHDFDPATGRRARRRLIAKPGTDLGRPDGAAVDEPGNYWSCGVSSGWVNVFSPKGLLLHRFRTPVAAPTMICFGGNDMRDIYLTSLRNSVDEARLKAFPASGCLHVTRSPIAGVSAWRFADI